MNTVGNKRVTKVILLQVKQLLVGLASASGVGETGTQVCEIID